VTVSSGGLVFSASLGSATAGLSPLSLRRCVESHRGASIVAHFFDDERNQAAVAKRRRHTIDCLVNGESTLSRVNSFAMGRDVEWGIDVSWKVCASGHEIR
jgi:hypothetical protein